MSSCNIDRDFYIHKNYALFFISFQLFFTRVLYRLIKHVIYITCGIFSCACLLRISEHSLTGIRQKQCSFVCHGGQREGYCVNRSVNQLVFQRSNPPWKVRNVSIIIIIHRHYCLSLLPRADTLALADSSFWFALRRCLLVTTTAVLEQLLEPRRS